MYRPLLILALTALALLPAASAIDNFKKAMSGSDSAAKKQAIFALVAGGEDNDVLPLLVNAVGDRQASRYAVQALRKRTGLSPAGGRGENPGYPGYPISDSASAWSSWLSARNTELAQKDKIAEAEAAAEEAQKQAEEAQKQAEDAEKLAETAKEIAADPEAAQAAADAAAAEGDESGEAAAPVADVIDYGRLDRIFFNDGSILRAFILTKRTDLDGNLTSVRIMHRNSAGEEILDAALIARIEEDIQ